MIRELKTYEIECNGCGLLVVVKDVRQPPTELQHWTSENGQPVHCMMCAKLHNDDDYETVRINFIADFKRGDIWGEEEFLYRSTIGPVCEFSNNKIRPHTTSIHDWSINSRIRAGQNTVRRKKVSKVKV